MKSKNIRLLLPEDSENYRELRLQGLREVPTAFSSSYEEEIRWTLELFSEQLKNSVIWGCFVGNKLVSIMGVYQQNSRKTCHIAHLFGVYTDSKYRNKGYASSIFKEMVKRLPAEIEQLLLSVEANNDIAYKWYKSMDFKKYGTQPQSLKIGSQYYDEHLMSKNIR